MRRESTSRKRPEDREGGGAVSDRKAVLARRPVVAWAFYDWITRGQPTVLGAASGVVAGLVCITPAAGFVNPMPALLMGAIAGIVCAIACSKLKNAIPHTCIRQRPRGVFQQLIGVQTFESQMSNRRGDR